MDINFAEFINDALLILVPVLYLIGMALKHAEYIKDKYIPLALGGVGIVLAVLQVGFLDGFTAQTIFSGVLQGILVAGTAVFSNQLVKQAQKEE
jgi:hypothetical protein